MNNKMQKTSQDKRTLDLADAKEKPLDGENPLINPSYYYIKCSTKREYKKSAFTYQIKVKTTLSNL